MLHLLNLLAAIALLVWGTHIVRTGVLRVFGESLRNVLPSYSREVLNAGPSVVALREAADRAVVECAAALG